MSNAYLVDIIAKYADFRLLPDHIKRIETHFNLLMEWSCKFNLIGNLSINDIAEALYLDSIISSHWILNVIPDCNDIHDVGSGAGFPGLFLPLFSKNKTFVTLHEARRKKTSFLRVASCEMGFDNVNVINRRVLHGDFSAGFVLSRAAFSSSAWLNLGLSLVKPSGLIAVFTNGEETFPPLITDNNFSCCLFDSYKYFLPLSSKKRAIYLFKKNDSFC